jgi:aspartyl-tRNA synthetase
MLRTHTAGELRAAQAGLDVTLCGWVASRRDHKGTIFVDLRDRYGLTQLVLRHGEGGGALSLGKGSELPLETCLRARGRVALRPEGLRNPRMPTGDIEVLVEEYDVLGPAETPPFPIEEDIDAAEELRMKYRYIDLRRDSMREMIVGRHRIAGAVRSWLSARDFVEVETPLLTRSTPEGARDYLVPSRQRKGSFYALPQSPQLFKQILMVAGLDRYYQIARCFRDEDLRADRQPEFTQIDVEMSFVEGEDVIGVLSGLAAHLWREFRGVDLALPLRSIPYGEAMERYGSDKPDLRFGLPISDLTEPLSGSGFRAFAETAVAGGRVRGLNAEKGAGLSRKQIGELEELARDNGGRGLVWFKVEAGGLAGPAAKFLAPAELDTIRDRLAGQVGDLLLLAADRKKTVEAVLGAVRLRVGQLLGLRREGDWSALIVTDFPLLEWNEEEGRFDALHHPFTAPRPDDMGLLGADPAAVRAQAYDLVINGVEVGGGSIRIHEEALQARVFSALGLGPEPAREKFGFLLEAFRYGAPPHGGFAIGFDRLVALLLGRSSIREVIPFPKTTSGQCPLTSAPAGVAAGQLADLGLRTGTEAS